MSRRNADVKYTTLEQALAKIAETRAYQTKVWPSITEPDRPFEEWLVLTDVYLAKLKAIYAETPSYVNDGTELNHEGMKRIGKYAAIVANLMLWAVQAAGEPLETDFKSRVAQEQEQLSQKIVKLRDFICGEVFKGLPKTEQWRLTRQLTAMEEYFSILRERTAHFGA